jgi:hypothetical protein
MPYGKHVVALLCAGLLFVATACGDDDPVTPTEQPYTITGTVQVKSGVELPPNAVLSAVWNVDSSPDYAYVFGKGTIDLTTMTFTITFGTPPQQALNISDGSQVPAGLPPLGVGIIALADFNGNDPHMLGATEARKPFGAVMNTGVIYVGGNPAAFQQVAPLSWVAPFPQGYSLGQGQKTTETHDIFVPIDMTNPVLRITDDPSEFVFPNWK